MNIRTSHLIGAVVLLALGGVVHGMWTHRWSNQTATTAGVDVLAKVEQPIGEWMPGAAIPIV